MATEVIENESESELRFASDMDLNKSDQTPDTPRIFEDLENGPAETLTSEEEPDILPNTTKLLSENVEDVLLKSTLKTGDPLQETATPDNGEKQEPTGRRRSPVGLLPPVELNESDPEPDTPTTFENLEHGPAETLTSEEEEEDEECDILQISTELLSDNFEDVLLKSTIQTGDPLQETATPDNAEKPEPTEMVTPSPVALSLPSPPVEQNESDQEPDTPTIFESVEQGPAETLTSEEEEEEEEFDILQISTDILAKSTIKLGDPLQETATPDNGEKQEPTEMVTSSPAALCLPSPPIAQNERDPEPDTPTTFENLEHGPAESLTSEEEKPDILQSRTELLSENAEDILSKSTIKLGDPLQETATPDNGEKQEPTEMVTSSPVAHCLSSPPIEQNERTELLSENAEDILSKSTIKLGDPLQETATPDNGEKQEPTEMVTSSPVAHCLSSPPIEQNESTEPLSENAEDTLSKSPTKTGDPLQETATPDNGEKQEPTEMVTPSPVRLCLPSSPIAHNESLERQDSVSEARLRLEGVELKEEWQDEDFPRPLPEEEEEDLEQELFIDTPGEGEPGTPSYGLNSDKKGKKKKLEAPDISLTLDRTGTSALTDELEESTELELDLDGMDTPSDNSNEFDWEDDLPKPKATELLRKGVESVQEISAAEEREEGRRWRVFRIGEQEHRVDMKAIEPYKRVISHGGYYGDGLNALIVFAVCFMPESNQPNYKYIMDNLFKYIIGTLELLVAENYMIVYLNGATSRRKMPSIGWLRRCYQQIDRRLRKNLKALIIVHPSWFIRTVLAITRPFISSKFTQKIKYVFSLTDLAELVPMEYVSIPECIKEYDEEKNRKKRKRIDQDMHGKVEMATAAVPQ
ncbi:hypothetical protein AAFF_G00107200 [Aldrovandia affinis]|uniref:CRAL-TRIO domain-containing protein n=1 Tax=Aldrovandia affinis TaxID=143900 RepID=A0AAD7T2H3_9TELE|nr:hypothetical protein AAFF_G00107200 [Aldrovandia affinis]